MKPETATFQQPASTRLRTEPSRMARLRFNPLRNLLGLAEHRAWQPWLRRHFVASTVIAAILFGIALTAAAWHAAGAGSPEMVLAIGVPVSLLLAPLVWFAATEHRRSAALAVERAVDLAASENRYRSLTHLCSDWYWETDSAYRFTCLGGALAESMLPRADTYLGRPLWQLHGIAPRSGNWDDYRALLATCQPFRDFEIVMEIEGRTHHVAISGGAVFDAQRRCIGYRGVGHDITAAAAVREELRRANERLTGTVTALEQRNQEGALLREMTEVLQICNDVAEACTVLPRYLGQFFAGLPATVYLRRAADGCHVCAASTDPAQKRSAALCKDQCCALRRNATHRAEQLAAETCCAHLGNRAEQFQVCLPMIAQGETIGLLQIAAPQALGVEDRATVERVAQQVTGQLALSFLNLRLRETLAAQAFRDPLTGLYNRRYMEDALARELLAAARAKMPVSLIMFDVDHFKRLNDGHGHDAGDAVLRVIGELARKHVRGSDIACRYGGEEFLLILPGTTAASAAARAGMLCAALRDLDLVHNGQSLGRITISAGVAECDGQSPDRLFSAVDQALYAAKRSGRDRVVIHGEKPRRALPLSVARARRHDRKNLTRIAA